MKRAVLFLLLVSLAPVGLVSAGDFSSTVILDSYGRPGIPYDQLSPMEYTLRKFGAPKFCYPCEMPYASKIINAEIRHAERAQDTRRGAGDRAGGRVFAAARYKPSGKCGDKNFFADSCEGVKHEKENRGAAASSKPVNGITVR